MLLSSYNCAKRLLSRRHHHHQCTSTTGHRPIPTLRQKLPQRNNRHPYIYTPTTIISSCQLPPVVDISSSLASPTPEPIITTTEDSMLELTTDTRLPEQLDTLFDTLDTRLAVDCPELATVLHELRQGTDEVLTYVHEYDFRDVEANGFRSYVRLVLRFLQVTHETRDLRLMSTHLLPVAIVLRTGLGLCKRFRGTSDDNLFGSSADDFPYLLDVFAEMRPQLDVVYDAYANFWLCASMKRALNGFTALMAIVAAGDPRLAARLLVDSRMRAQAVAHIAQNATVEFVKGFWGLTETPLARSALPLLAKTPPLAREVYVPPQTRWSVSPVEACVLRNDDDDADSTSHANRRPLIRCRLLCGSEQPSGDALVLHIHGGGFVSQTPDSHEVYLRQWAVQLAPVPILSVDYTLSPEAKYPIALQQLLDVYLWLTSTDAAVAELGIKPRRVVICGDSAGGNLSLATCLAIHDAWKQDAHIVRPRGIVCFYTPLLLQTRASPSRLFTAVDTLLPLGVLLACLEAYAPDINGQNNNNPSTVNDDDEDEFEFVTVDDVPPLDSDHTKLPHDWPPRSTPWSRMRRTFRHVRGPDNVATSSPRPWYRQPRPQVLNKLTRLNAATENPFVSPLLAEPDFTDVALYLVALAYDACLDDSVQMAKKWKGAINLDVLDDLPHGFLNFVSVSAESRRGSDLCVDRVRQALT
ncbi:hormone-sensitive lipase-like [Oppia nitens]|uniref:hormone-sensitive lipase-like n=1 Tax=Oppia nitens TaxID=1686743 RepID=UPI0023DBC205|nr:hormone-sensitive lipase-like [Oppia nitens]